MHTALFPKKFLKQAILAFFANFECVCSEKENYFHKVKSVCYHSSLDYYRKFQKSRHWSRLLYYHSESLQLYMCTDRVCSGTAGERTKCISNPYPFSMNDTRHQPGILGWLIKFFLPEILLKFQISWNILLLIW